MHCAGGSFCSWLAHLNAPASTFAKFASMSVVSLKSFLFAGVIMFVLARTMPVLISKSLESKEGNNLFR